MLNVFMTMLLFSSSFLALLCCSCSYGLSRLDSGVVETIAALNQFFQPLGEACCRSAVDHLMIKADRQTEIFPDSYAPVNDISFHANTAHRNIECLGGGWRDAPSGLFPKHTNRREAHRPKDVLLHLWIRSTYTPEGPKETSDQKGRQEQHPVLVCGRCPGFYLFSHLGCPDLLMNLSEGLLIRCSNDVDSGLLLASHVTLNRGRHVHFIKQDKVLPAFIICLHGFVLIDRFSQARRDECRERQGLSGVRFVLPQERARSGHIDFD